MLDPRGSVGFRDSGLDFRGLVSFPSLGFGVGARFYGVKGWVSFSGLGEILGFDLKGFKVFTFS